MDFNEYQKAALRTADENGTFTSQLIAGAMGLVGEAGETCDYIKKIVFHGHKLNHNKIAEEVGDTLWYAALLADAINISLEEIAERNIAKLKQRYPDGFDPEKSKKRIG